MDSGSSTTDVGLTKMLTKLKNTNLIETPIELSQSVIPLKNQSIPKRPATQMNTNYMALNPTDRHLECDNQINNSHRRKMMN